MKMDKQEPLVDSSIGNLSVANRSQSIDVPDFTGGSWKTNKPHGINLETGGTTKVLEIKEVDADYSVSLPNLLQKVKNKR